ncbi:MAG: hypothetical protein CL687_04340 [Candidatus Pelagibacter sp.]|nr:hypothetical protein [Candidatus Pelagibacter sp.]
MNDNLDKILAEISAGELIDKISILEIKKEKIKNKEKLTEIEKELKSLTGTYEQKIKSSEKLENLSNKLKEINLKLWNIEDEKREAEKEKKFDSTFVELARNVYKFNDERAEIKLRINKLLGSNIKEVKSYK